MNRTINGKELCTIMEELSASFAEDQFKVNPAGFNYLPFEVYLERLDNVVGNLNYDFEISQTTWVQIEDKYHISTVGKITLRDDLGEVVTVKSATGDADVIMKKTGEVVKPGNDAKTAAHDAFKGCCRMLGVGDEQLRDKRKNRNGSSSGSSGGSSQKGTEEIVRVLMNGETKSLGGKGYKVPAIIRQTGEKVSLVLWNDAVEAVQKYMPIAEFFTKYNGKEFTAVCTRSSFKYNNGSTEEQLVMLRPYCGKEVS